MRTHGITHWDPDNCTGCRYKTLNLRPTAAFQPHFNYSVGQYVNTETEFKSVLSRCADENSLKTGTDHVYEMRDPSELAATGVPYPQSDDILNAQGKAIAEKYAN